MATMPERIDVDHDIALHRYAPDDARSVLDLVLRNYDDLHRWMPWAQQRPTLEEETAFLERCEWQWDNGEGYQTRIEVGGHYVGSVGTWPVEGDRDLFEIGYWLDRDARGSGVCTRSVIALVDAAHTALSIRRFTIRCDEANERSQAVARRAGFTLLGTQRVQPAAAGDTGITLTFSRSV